MTTGELIEGPEVVAALKAGHAMSWEYFIDGNRHRSVLTRKVKRGQLDFEFCGADEIVLDSDESFSLRRP